MDTDWLKGLAVRLRGLLGQRGLAVSHGQALDLVAALPGLRNWPEVMAFPERLAGCSFDLVSAGRLARRLERVHGFAATAESLWGDITWSPLYRAPADTRPTTRLIVTTSDSGAGHLKQSRIADRVIPQVHRLVWGPMPATANPATFFADREALYDRDPQITAELYPWERGREATRLWCELLVICQAYERVELWIDPDPNAQLLLIQLLDWFGRYPDLVAKLFVVHADVSLGEREAGHFATTDPDIAKVGVREIAIATRAWTAYCRPTPEAWFALLGMDLDPLPHLRRAILLLLGELPAIGTSLGATEKFFLDVVAPGGIGPARIMRANTRDNPSSVYRFFEEMRILKRLAEGPEPAILGLQEETFEFLKPDPERRERYMGSRLSVSDLGRSLLDGKADFARHRTIHRWWGGTLLTNVDLWHWDAAKQKLVGP